MEAASVRRHADVRWQFCTPTMRVSPARLNIRPISRPRLSITSYRLAPGARLTEPGMPQDEVAAKGLAYIFNHEGGCVLWYSRSASSAACLGLKPRT